MNEGPFASFAPAGDAPLVRAAGLRPLSPVLGVCAVRISATNPAVSGLDGDERPAVVAAFGHAVATGLDRLKAEAAAQNAAFVADLDLRLPEGLAAGRGAGGVFSAGGTAYACAHNPGEAPALTNLSGGEVARLLLAGWRPTGLCVGYSFYAQSPGYRAASLAASLGPFGRNVEHPDLTRALRAANALALARLERDARAGGGEGLVGLRTHLCRVHAGERATISLVLSAIAVRRAGPTRPMRPEIVLPL